MKLSAGAAEFAFNTAATEFVPAGMLKPLAFQCSSLVPQMYNGMLLLRVQLQLPLVP
jgi:hypothetical protein